MLNVLLIYDDRDAIRSVEQILAQLHIAPMRLILEEFHPEFLGSDRFDLIIFELFGEINSSVVILGQIEKWATTSGMEVPPVIVVTEDNIGQIEQTLRTANVSFFFVKPISEEELRTAIQQTLLNHHTS